MLYVAEVSLVYCNCIGHCIVIYSAVVCNLGDDHLILEGVTNFWA